MTARQFKYGSLLLAGILGFALGKVIGPWWASIPACALMGFLLGDVSYYLAHHEHDDDDEERQ